MDRLFSMLAGGILTGSILGSALGSAAFGQALASQSVVAPSSVTPTSTAPVTSENTDEALDPASLLPDLPALPRTKASLIGGTIQKVDRVRDQLTLQIFGGGKMKIFFDPRSNIVQGSNQASPADLRPGDRVYVDTILDGSTVFARDIRLATAALSGGKSQGVVVSYRADKAELVVRDLLSPNPIKLRISSGTQIMQDGHITAASRLVPGTLVNVDFVSQKDVRDARQVSILAIPGTSFTFGGVVTSLDLRVGLLVLTSSSDHKTYEIYLDPASITVDDRLRLGADVTAITNFDGSRYVAHNLTINSH
jgi:Domain of unknown function (DUF5666)